MIEKSVPYVEFDKSAATWLFQLIGQRYEHRSTIVTSNKSFADWGDIFADTTLAGALLDRLLHRSHILSLKGDSYRLRGKTQGTTAAKRKSGAQVGGQDSCRRLGGFILTRPNWVRLNPAPTVGIRIRLPSIRTPVASELFRQRARGRPF